MKKITEHLNIFLGRTSIHGLSYLTKDETKCSRFIWTIIVLTASTLASYLLYNTVFGFEEHYTSTTLETRSIQDFPFPAVSFYPGDYDLKNSLKRLFLNQLEFTRFRKDNQLKDNEQFMEKFGWLISPMHNKLFEKIKTYLLTTKQSFIQSKGRIVEKQACMLVALDQRKINVQRTILKIFLENMYKFIGFRDSQKFLTKGLNTNITNLVISNNVTKEDISSACKNKVMNKDMMIN